VLQIILEAEARYLSNDPQRALESYECAYEKLRDTPQGASLDGKLLRTAFRKENRSLRELAELADRVHAAFETIKNQLQEKE
jgi:hypothetical protein